MLSNIERERTNTKCTSVYQHSAAGWCGWLLNRLTTDGGIDGVLHASGAGQGISVSLSRAIIVMVPPSLGPFFGPSDYS